MEVARAFKLLIATAVAAESTEATLTRSEERRARARKFASYSGPRR